MKKLKEKMFASGIALAGRSAFLFLFLLLSAFDPTNDKRNALIIAVYDQQAATNHIVHLQRISFAGGSPGQSENIMDVLIQLPGDRVPRIRFDLGNNTIYRNRWIITAYGNVIDLEKRKVLVDAHDQFVRANGDSIIFYTNDIARGKFYSVLNLSTGIYEQVKSVTFHALTGKDVEPDCSARNFRIYYYPPSASKVELVKDAGFGEDISLIPQAKPACPIFWLNDDNFIYPNYSSAHDYVSIMKVNFTSKEQEKIGSIDQLPENHRLSYFYRSPAGEIIYSCARGYYKIDPEKKEVTEAQFLSAGNGFSVAVNETDKKGKVIKNGEQIVGTYFCNMDLTATAPGLIAFPYEIVLGDEHYLQGAAVYSAATKQWKTIGDSDLSAVVGWVEE